jgi:hypothetical protein
MRRRARWKSTWSDAELEKLKAPAGMMPMTMIAKELGRTTGTVLAKGDGGEVTSDRAHSQRAPVKCRQQDASPNH